MKMIKIIRRTNFKKLVTNTIICWAFQMLCYPLFSQSDTLFLDTVNAVVNSRDSQYENFNKIERLKRKDALATWQPQVDTIFFQDKNIFRVRKYFYDFLLISIDSFYQYPYADGTIYLTSVVLHIGKIAFVQSVNKRKSKSISVQDLRNNRKEIYLIQPIQKSKVITFSGIRIELGENNFIETINFMNDSLKLGLAKSTQISFPKDSYPYFQTFK